MSEYPDDLRYTKDHEWARREEGRITIGITQFAVESLGDITQVDLPPEGETFNKGQVFGTVESVKAVSDLFMPCAGKIVRINDPLKDSPETLNEDCYDEGWMVQIEPLAGSKDFDELLDAAAYEDYLKEHA